MNKLPVFRTFGNALGFTLWNFFTIFRLSWLPFAALFGTMYLVGYFAAGAMTTGALGTPVLNPRDLNENIVQFLLLESVMILLQAIVIAAVAVSIHRVILFGDRRPGSFFNFAFGITEFLYVMMGALTLLIFIAIMGALLTPVIYIVSQGDFAGFFKQFRNFPASMPGFVQSGEFVSLMLVYCLGGLVAFYFFLRLAVWPPAVVATKRLSPAEAWGLTRGNVWRLIGLFLLPVLLIWIVVIPATASYWYYNSQELQAVHEVAPIAGLPNPDPTAAKEAARRVMEHKMQSFQQFMPALWLAYLLFYIFFTGLSVAMLSYAYKALKGYEAGELIPAPHE